MKSYGQFCSVARALDLLGERWTLLIVRELLMGSRRFGDVQRGIPRISRTMLSARFRELLDAGVIGREDGGEGSAGYHLTPTGLELLAVVRELGTWGQRWLPRELPPPSWTRASSSGTSSGACVARRYRTSHWWSGSS
jgi:DNA-binding HxlR family transcriptional regulator